MTEKTDHWNNVYKNKKENEVSWYQEVPLISLKLIEELPLSNMSSIIDIGGGESRLVDNLLDKHFTDVTVLDISEVSLEKVATRLNTKSQNAKLIVSDVLNFTPTQQYDLWHDRAAFHFLANSDDIEKYVQLASLSVKKGGSLIIGTFSKTGPDKCSNLPISKYSHEELIKLFSEHFSVLKYFYEAHETPWSSKQDFVFCTFTKKN